MIEPTNARYGVATVRHGTGTGGAAPAGQQQLDDAARRAMTAIEDHALAADVVGGRAEHAEHDELARRRAPISGRAALIAVEPPDEHGDDGGVRVLGQQLVGVGEQHRRGGQRRR